MKQEGSANAASDKIPQSETKLVVSFSRQHETRNLAHDSRLAGVMQYHSM